MQEDDRGGQEATDRGPVRRRGRRALRGGGPDEVVPRADGRLLRRQERALRLHNLARRCQRCEESSFIFELVYEKNQISFPSGSRRSKMSTTWTSSRSPWERCTRRRSTFWGVSAGLFSYTVTILVPDNILLTNLNALFLPHSAWGSAIPADLAFPVGNEVEFPNQSQ